MIGDRTSDVVAGVRAGCRTILVETGRHLDPQIEVLGGFLSAEPDMSCQNLGEAARFLLAGDAS